MGKQNVNSTTFNCKDFINLVGPYTNDFCHFGREKLMFFIYSSMPFISSILKPKPAHTTEITSACGIQGQFSWLCSHAAVADHS